MFQVWEKVKQDCKENPKTIDFAAEAADGFGSILESSGIGASSMKDSVGQVVESFGSMLGSLATSMGKQFTDSDGDYDGKYGEFEEPGSV